MGSTTSFDIGGIDFSKTSGSRKKWDPKQGKWVNQNTYDIAGFKWHRDRPSGNQPTAPPPAATGGKRRPKKTARKTKRTVRKTKRTARKTKRT